MELAAFALACFVSLAFGVLCGSVCTLLMLHASGRLVVYRGQVVEPLRGRSVIPPRGGSGTAPPDPRPSSAPERF